MLDPKLNDRVRIGSASGTTRCVTRLLAPSRPSPLALALLVLAAVALLIAGFEHARLWHRGYAEIAIVGPLFLLNAIGTVAVVLCLVFDRVALFVLGAVAICAGSLISIVLSHSATFFQWREAGYDSTAKLIVATEIAALALALAGAAAGGLRRREPSERLAAVTA